MPVQTFVEVDMDFVDMGLALQLAVAFGGGLLAFLSPCVLPLLPGYLGLMSGYSVADLRAGEASRGRMLRATVLFVLGFTAVFVASGALATSISTLLLENQSVINRVAGTFVIVFGIVMIGMSFTNRGVFGFLSRERRMEVRPSRLGLWAPPVMGVAFGFGWSPCIGTILTGVLAVAATQDTVGQGMLLLLAFSLGMGVPFILSGLGVSRALRSVKAIGPWLRPINITGGVLMTAFGILLVTNNVFRLAVFFQKVFGAVPFLERLAEI